MSGNLENAATASVPVGSCRRSPNPYLCLNATIGNIGGLAPFTFLRLSRRAGTPRPPRPCPRCLPSSSLCPVLSATPPPPIPHKREPSYGVSFLGPMLLIRGPLTQVAHFSYFTLDPHPIFSPFKSVASQSVLLFNSSTRIQALRFQVSCDGPSRWRALQAGCGPESLVVFSLLCVCRLLSAAGRTRPEVRAKAGSLAAGSAAAALEGSRSCLCRQGTPTKRR